MRLETATTDDGRGAESGSGWTDARCNSPKWHAGVIEAQLGFAKWTALDVLDALRETDAERETKREQPAAVSAEAESARRRRAARRDAPHDKRCRHTAVAEAASGER